MHTISCKDCQAITDLVWAGTKPHKDGGRVIYCPECGSEVITLYDGQTALLDAEPSVLLGGPDG